MESRQPYPTDLKDSEWQILAPLIPAAKSGGRPEVYPKREIVNAILYSPALAKVNFLAKSLSQ